MNKQFIKATEKYCTFEEYVPAPYLRRAFTLDFVPDMAEISICGLGFYLLYVNGKEITKGEFAPYISNPDQYCYYDKYDILPYLKKGKNAIGIVLGNGLNNAFGGSIWDFDKGEWRSAPRVALELIAEGEGKKLEFAADESFKVHSSPIIFDDERMGEYYDANLEIDGWCNADFDDSKWDNAIIAETSRGELKECTAEPIHIIREIKPVKITKEKRGYIYDFGENAAGVLRLSVNAKKGQKITMWHGELLKDDEFYYENIIFDRPESQFYWEYNQKNIYTAKGEGKETYIPRFAYFGFRYVLVEGITEEQATEELLTYLVMNSDLKDIGGFKCSNDTVNKLYEMVRRSDLANFYYFPTDCPHREKNGWTGDASMSSDHMMLMYDVSASWHEWLCNMRKCQLENGMLPGIVPTGTWGYECGDNKNAGYGPVWDSVLFNIPYQLYKCRGDLDIIRENAHAMMRYLEFIMSVRDDKGTVSAGLGDWLPTGCTDYCILPIEISSSITVMDIARKASEMYNAIGNKHLANFANGIYEEMRETVRRELVDFDAMTISGDSQTAQAMGIYYGVFNEDEIPKAFEKLVEFVHRDNDTFMGVGFLGLHTIFNVLSDYGEAELAYKMIMHEGFPSYANLIDVGETSLVEWFRENPYEVGSHNHHFFGDIARWFTRAIAGLDIVRHDYVEFKPNFIGEISNASAFYDLPAGRTSIEWKREGDVIKISYDSPVEFKLILPEGYKEENGVIKKVL